MTYMTVLFNIYTQQKS